MERKPSKHARSKSGGALAAFLRSTAASFSSSTFASRPVAGGGKPSFNHRNAFSGPMVSIVPPEARGGGRRRAKQGGGSGYRTPEASSPKVSCIGQIKRSKSKTARAKARKATTTNVAPACGMDGGACALPPRPSARSRTKRSLVKRMFCRRSMSRSSSSSSSSRSHRSSGGTDFFKGRHGSSAAVAAAPAPGAAGLGQMKRFTSGRGAFQEFDWRDAGRRGSDVDGDDDYVDDGFVAFSAPLVLGGGVVASEPRKEVNLWRRRPMSPPTPLELP